jgi:hypothetical protein
MATYGPFDQVWLKTIKEWGDSQLKTYLSPCGHGVDKIAKKGSV